MNLRYEIEHLCSMYDIKLDPDKGQHFIISRKILRKEVVVADTRGTDIVLDIGSGFGYLTEEIAKVAKKVYAVEIDKKVTMVFKHRLKNLLEEGKVFLIEGDFLRISIPKEITSIISNPPYHIISQIILKVLREVFPNETFKGCVMILQHDYVRKLLAKPGSKLWGRLPAAFRFFARGKIIAKVPATVFFPRPKVSSVMVKMWPIRESRMVDFETYERITDIIFSGSVNKKAKKIIRDHLRAFVGNWREYLAKLEKS